MKVRIDLQKILKSIPEKVTVVAATKYLDSVGMLDLYNGGIKDFGENRVDAFLMKYENLKSYKDITWHFIGHLQRNKAKLVLDKIDYLHSLDSLELAKLINEKRETPLKTFIEVSINLEESKNGVPFYKVEEFLKEVLKFHKIQVVGFMMMAVKDSLDTRAQFAKLRELRDEMEKKFEISLPYLSMGMSDDYEEALKEGATHIRLGRVLLEE